MKKRKESNQSGRAQTRQNFKIRLRIQDEMLSTQICRGSVQHSMLLSGGWTDFTVVMAADVGVFEDRSSAVLMPRIWEGRDEHYQSLAVSGQSLRKQLLESRVITRVTRAGDDSVNG